MVPVEVYRRGGGPDCTFGVCGGEARSFLPAQNEATEAGVMIAAGGEPEAPGAVLLGGIRVYGMCG